MRERGIYVGLPYEGDAPDIGAIESPDIIGVWHNLDYDWVYQNTPITTQWRHMSELELTIIGADDYSITVEQNPNSTGNVSITETANPLVYNITGGQRGIGNTGPVFLNIEATDLSTGESTWDIVELNVRELGDLNGDGYTNVNDMLILIGAWGSCP